MANDNNLEQLIQEYQLTKEDMKKITKKMEEYKNKNTNQNPDQLLVDYIKELRDDLC